MSFRTVGVVGAGTMGHGIAHACALAGQSVVLFDVDNARVEAGLRKIAANLDKGVEKGKLSPAQRDASIARIAVTTALGDLGGCDVVVEAVPERLELKQDLFRQLEPIVGADCVLATNTSSLSVARIAQAVADGSRVIGTHFFNPVHIMTLLEIVVHGATGATTLDRVRAWGVAIGKECITVQDFPGFATSRLGVCLGMEAIRMVEQGVASADDIDKAMVLGYRHPVGPLKLTDMVGLDVRMAIGEYLARELGNPAFEPPALMRKMVAEGKLGQKSGEGFYKY
ncbi:MAG: 3-hydroxyacyl-CoA dehydrogenase family protein [Deltaproteobacteria bacterium]|nr:3-hydroxyacyl-CoA dehydrogenase family protein [Deltaproteobacteria bacterium]